MNQIAMPSRAKMMQRVIADVKNISSSFEDSSWALNKLLIFLEDIDDAYSNNLSLLTLRAYLLIYLPVFSFSCYESSM